MLCCRESAAALAQGQIGKRSGTMKYDFKQIEKKWQRKWDEEAVFAASDDYSRPKFYGLVEFPYPSGQGLHVGHPRGYTALDIVSRKRRMQGYNVLFPMGWDAFGLPTENFAMKNKIHPKKVTADNVRHFKQQLQSLGFSFDWSREINTTDPAYYHWTQWIFLKLFEHGLAYKQEMPINWCTSCKVGLSNEEVVDGVCERCGSEVVQKRKSEWMLRITEYAQRLIDDLDDLDFIEKVKIQQKNWIGRSEGAEVIFRVAFDDADSGCGCGAEAKTGSGEAGGGQGAAAGACCEEKGNAAGPGSSGVAGACCAADSAAGGCSAEAVTAGGAADAGTGESCAAGACCAAGGCGAEAKTGSSAADAGTDESSAAGGKSEAGAAAGCGAAAAEGLEGADSFTVFTTRPDTLFGATYTVLSPEHPLLEAWKEHIRNYDEVVAYREAAARKSEFERTELCKDKTGVALDGVWAVNPVNGARLPVWVSDYVLMTYGTGAIMAVPAHDERDWEFAKKFGIDIIEVVAGGADVGQAPYTDTATGVLINSGYLDGLSVDEAKQTVIERLSEQGLARKKINYKLRDWVFSRQRYWGEPIPLVHCDTCGWVALDESELPLTLPELDDYEPGENGESPLARMTDWVNTTCPKCGGPAKRETDTMPQWAGSSWYYLRYIDPQNDAAPASMDKLRYWLPVDWYNGGMEHTTLHLLYSRFWHKFLYDIGVVPTKEPYQKRTSHGMILGANGEKMSKSRGNVVNPDDVVRDYGADTFRTYEMFIGAFDQSTPWSEDGVKGCFRFLERVWHLADMVTDGEGYSADLETAMHKTIKKVSEDIERMKFNTAIAALMSLVNDFYKKGSVTRGELRTFLLLLNPTAPHITEEMSQMLGLCGMLAREAWPVYDEAKTVDASVEIVLQVSGKIRDKIVVDASLDTDGLREAALASEKVQAAIAGKQVVKVICVPGRLVNIVAR